MGVKDSGAASVAAALARRGAAAPHGGDPWPTVDAVRRLRTGWGMGRGGRGDGGDYNDVNDDDIRIATNASNSPGVVVGGNAGGGAVLVLRLK